MSPRFSAPVGLRHGRTALQTSKSARSPALARQSTSGQSFRFQQGRVTGAQIRPMSTVLPAAISGSEQSTWLRGTTSDTFSCSYASSCVRFGAQGLDTVSLMTCHQCANWSRLSRILQGWPAPNPGHDKWFSSTSREPLAVRIGPDSSFPTPTWRNKLFAAFGSRRNLFLPLCAVF